MMLEFGQMVGLLSAGFLIVAVAAWVRLWRRPVLQPIDGHPAAIPTQTELASQLMVLAFGLSALAAILAVLGWIGF